MKKVLNVTYPFITSWTWHANLFAMIQTIPEAQEWIYSNYIQLHCHPDERTKGLFFEFIPPYFSILSCPVLHNQYIDRNFLLNKWKDWKTFLIDCINNNYYVYGICNERYMLHREDDFFHELFIYGYDLDKQVFYCADFPFSNSGKYSFIQKPFEEVCQGLSDVTYKTDYLLRNEGGIILSKIDLKKDKYKMNIDYLKRNLQDYLEGVNSFSQFDLFFNTEIMSQDSQQKPFEYHVFGIKVYEALAKYLLEVEEGQRVDMRAFHNLYEHKKLMVKRIEYLQDKKGICQKIDKNVYMGLLNKSSILANLAIKFNYLNDFALLKTMLKYIDDIKNIEEKEIMSLIKAI